MEINDSTLSVYYQQPLVLPVESICKNMRSQRRLWVCWSEQASNTATPRAQKRGALTKKIETEGGECGEIPLYLYRCKKNPCWYEAKKIIPKWKPTCFSSTISKFLIFWIFLSYLILINRKCCAGRCRWTVERVQFPGANNKLLVTAHPTHWAPWL